MSDDLRMLRNSWLRALRSEHKSKETVENYGRAAAQFIDFLAAPRAVALADEEETPAELLARRPVRDETDIHRDHVTTFIAELLRTRAPATAHARFSALHIWFEWMIAQPDIDMDRNPMQGMKRPVLPEPTGDFLNEDEIRRLIGTCDPKTFRGQRDEAIIRLFADTGMRCGELQALMAVEIIDGVRVPFVDLDTESVYVVGKGRRPRTIAFGAKTAVALDRYIRARRKHPHRAAPHLWLPIRNTTRQVPLTHDAIYQMLRKRGEAVGIEGVHPHKLRHSWADGMKRAGLDRGDLKNQGGWRSDKMVDRYGARAATERAMTAARRLSFGDRI